jgi:hypothetical protein
MKFKKKLSLITFLSVIVCILSVATNAAMNNTEYSVDVYGWPQPFLKIVFSDNKIAHENFEPWMLLADFLYSFIAVLLFFLLKDIMTIRRKSMLATSKEEEEQKLMNANAIVRKFLTEANKASQ